MPSGKAVRELDLGRDGTVSDLAISGDGQRLEVLERIGNDGANRLIERLAKGPADAGLTLDARAVQLRRRN